MPCRVVIQQIMKAIGHRLNLPFFERLKGHNSIEAGFQPSGTSGASLVLPQTNISPVPWKRTFGVLGLLAVCICRLTSGMHDVVFKQEHEIRACLFSSTQPGRRE